MLLDICEGLGGLDSNDDRISHAEEDWHTDLTLTHESHHLILSWQVLHIMFEVRFYEFQEPREHILEILGFFLVVVGSHL